MDRPTMTSKPSKSKIRWYNTELKSFTTKSRREGGVVKSKKASWMFDLEEQKEEKSKGDKTGGCFFQWSLHRESKKTLKRHREQPSYLPSNKKMYLQEQTLQFPPSQQNNIIANGNITYYPSTLQQTYQLSPTQYTTINGQPSNEYYKIQTTIEEQPQLFKQYSQFETSDGSLQFNGEEENDLLPSLLDSNYQTNAIQNGGSFIPNVGMSPKQVGNDTLKQETLPQVSEIDYYFNSKPNTEVVDNDTIQAIDNKLSKCGLSREKLREMYDGVKNPIVFMDSSNGVYIWMNLAFKKMTNRTEKECMKITFSYYFEKYTQLGVLHTIYKQLLKELPSKFEVQTPRIPKTYNTDAQANFHITAERLDSIGKDPQPQMYKLEFRMLDKNQQETTAE
jgi:hypothetical protein